MLNRGRCSLSRLIPLGFRKGDGIFVVCLLGRGRDVRDMVSLTGAGIVLFAFALLVVDD